MFKLTVHTQEHPITQALGLTRPKQTGNGSTKDWGTAARRGLGRPSPAASDTQAQPEGKAPPGLAPSLPPNPELIPSSHCPAVDPRQGACDASTVNL